MKILSPTPWRFAEHSSEVNFTHTIVAHDGERIARVCRVSKGFASHQDEGANASLMAVAPELYENLKSCVATLVAQGITGPKVIEATRLLSRMRNELDDHE